MEDLLDILDKRYGEFSLSLIPKKGYKLVLLKPDEDVIPIEELDPQKDDVAINEDTVQAVMTLDGVEYPFDKPRIKVYPLIEGTLEEIYQWLMANE